MASWLTTPNRVMLGSKEPSKGPPAMFIIEYFDRTTFRWRPMPSDAWSEHPTEHATTAAAELTLARYQRRSPSCQFRVTATAPA